MHNTYEIVSAIIEIEKTLAQVKWDVKNNMISCAHAHAADVQAEADNLYELCKEARLSTTDLD